MKLFALALILLVLAACKKDPPPGMSLTELELQILDSIHHNEGEFALAFKSLDSLGEAIYVNKNEMFHAASTMKTPVMIEAFKQQAAGLLSLDDTLIVTNRFRSIVDSSWYELTPNADSEHQLYDMMGQPRTIRQLVEDMITQSSNIATNMLVARLGADNITNSMRELGAHDIYVLRGVEDIKAFEQSLSNMTNASSLLVIYEKLALGQVVSPQASAEMVDILKRQQFRDVIPAKLPDNVQVAHKTGTLSQVHHDSGIVYLPDGRKYVLVLLSKNLMDFDKGTELLANISFMLYQYMQAKTPS